MRSYPASMRANTCDGFTLIEAVIVMGLLGVIVAGVWLAAGAAYDSMRQQVVSKNLATLVLNIQNYYAYNNAVAIDTNAANLINSSVVPADMIGPDRASLIHPWGQDAGGNVFLYNDASHPGSFVVTFTKPANVINLDWIGICNRMIARNFNPGKWGGMTWGVSNSSAMNTGTPTGAACTSPADSPSFEFNNK